MWTKRSLCACVAATAMSFGAEAAAQPAGGLRLSVERMFGFTYDAVSSGAAGSSARQTSDWLTVNLLGGSFSTLSSATVILTTSQMPRLALDYQFPSRVTVGGAAFFTWGSLTDEDGDGFSAWGIGLAPRVGYAAQVGARWSFWPRAGFTVSYLRSASERDGVTSNAYLSYLPFWINLEALLVYSPSENVGLSLGGVLDIPLLGDVTSVSTASTRESTFMQLVVGLQAGVIVRL